MDARLRLITTPVSHYCEKGRWALDAAGLAYREDRHPPGIHRMAVARHGASTAPVLVTGRQAIRGSDRILAYAAAQPGGADLMPADRSERADVQRWLDICDRRLGIDTRRWIYSWVLDDVPAFLALLGSGLGDRGRRTLARVHPAVRPVIRRAFRVGAAARRESEEQVAEVFAQADAQRGGSPYLVGDRFTGADLTFAALSAPMVGPPQYGVPLPAAEELPPDLRAAMERWRATPSGAAVLAIYERHRLAGAPRPTPTTPGGVTP